MALDLIYWGYIGIMEKKMETILGLFWICIGIYIGFIFCMLPSHLHRLMLSTRPIMQQCCLSSGGGTRQQRVSFLSTYRMSFSQSRAMTADAGKL